MSIDLEARADAPAEEQSTGRVADEAAIRDLFDELLAAWGRGDGTAYGAQFAEDADYIAFDGSRTIGREVIAASHQELFDRWLKGTRLVGRIESIRFLSPDVALVIATGGTLFPGQSPDQARRPSIQTLLAIKSDGRWRFAAFHNIRIEQWNWLKLMILGIATKVFRR